MLIISLKNQAKFDLVNKSGYKFYSKFFLMVIAKDLSEISDPAPNNIIFLGMKVGKKLGIAVVRNKIKRRIRHLIQILSKNQGFSASRTGIIIIPRKGFDKVPFTTLLDELNRLWLRDLTV